MKVSLVSPCLPIDLSLGALAEWEASTKWVVKLGPKQGVFEMNPYEEFKAITDRYYTDWQMPQIKTFVDLLNRHGIKTRQDDGTLREATFSVPKTVPNGLVLGLRYIKKDGSFSEDLFLFQKGKPIQPGYKEDLERILPEYSGTHKRPPSP